MSSPPNESGKNPYQTPAPGDGVQASAGAKPAPPGWKRRCSAIGSVTGIALFLMGGLMACYCSAPFILAGVFFLGPLFYGRSIFRIVAAVLLVLSVYQAVDNFALEQAMHHH